MEGDLSEAEHAYNDYITSGEAVADDAALEQRRTNQVIAKHKSRCLATYFLFDQDKVWYDAQANCHGIAEMSVRYKTNVLRFLRRRAPILAERYSWGLLYSMDLPSGLREVAPGGEPYGPVLSMGAIFSDDGGNMDVGFEVMMDEITADPAAWLDHTPLVERMSRDVAEGIGGDDD